MNLEQKLRQLRRAAQPRDPDRELEQTLEYLRRLEQPSGPRPLPAQRAAKGIEEYVEGELARNDWGEYFLARQAFPFGRPYGKLRIGDISTADLSPLNLLLPDAALPAPSRLVFLDTETTGLAGGTGTCAFLIGIGTVEGMQFVVRQFFLRDYPEEKAVLRALAEVLESSDGLVTYNGKTFDVPLLETRYALARLKSPFARLLHLDALHPARRLWKLRLESCRLTDLESAVLGIGREGDVPGSEIPGIYFDYLRTGDARGLQPVFYHNALDIMTLAALTVELARAIGDAGASTLASPVDLFSLSRIFETAGSREQSVATCQRALSGGLPEQIEGQALRQLAMAAQAAAASRIGRGDLARTGAASRPRWPGKHSSSWPSTTSTIGVIRKARWTLRSPPWSACASSLRLCRTPRASPIAWSGCNESSPASKAPSNFRLLSRDFSAAFWVPV